MSQHVLTLDLGTTYIKAALFDANEACVGIERIHTPITEPKPGWCEIDPQAFQHAIVRLCTQLQAKHIQAYAQVRYVSFATQANTFVLLDDNDQPLTPFIVWTDQRAKDQTEWIEQFNALPQRYSITGVVKMAPGFWPASARWVSQHRPDVWAKARRFCLLCDWLTFWMTGSHITEAGVAGLSGALDIHTLRWWEPAMELLGIDPALLPQAVYAGTDAGPMLPKTADKLGLPSDTHYVMGCLDQYAGAVGAGTTTPGAVSETTGTVLAVVQCSNTFDPTLARRGVYQGPAYKRDLYYRMSYSSISASLLEHYQRSHAPELSFDELGKLAEEALQNGDALKLFRDASRDGSKPIFESEPTSHGQATLAIMQGVSAELVMLLQIVCGDQQPEKITCLGGAARSTFWRSLKEQAAGCATQVVSCDEPTSLGAAILAHKHEE